MPRVDCHSVLRLLAVALFAFVTSRVGATDETTVDLTPQVGANDLAEVTLEMTVGGTMRIPEDRGRSAETKDLPMSVAATLRYDEYRVAPTEGAQATRAIRWYHDADATLKVENDGSTPKLSDARRLIVVNNPAARLVFSSPNGLLEREELDLVDAVGDSLALDQLLPTEPVGDGATWKAEPAALAALLSLDNVAACEVQSVLDKFNADFALIRLAGTVVGSVDGASTEMELRGVYLFDRKVHRVTKCNLAVKEVRAVGGATPGLDSVAKLRLDVKPIAASDHLTEAIIAPLRAPSTARLDLLRLEAAKQGFRLLHDRRWFVTSRDRETTTLRRVDQADVVAQCTITSLPAKSAGRQTTLDEFEQDIRRSLGENFGELVSSRQWVNAYRHQCLEVVVRGKAQDVPVEWHYYLIAPENGPRVSLSVTIEGQMVNRLANADRMLVNGLQLTADAPPAMASQPVGELNNSNPANGPRQPGKQILPNQSLPTGSSPAAGPIRPQTRPATALPPAATAPPAAAAAAQPVPPPVRRPPSWEARAQNLDRSLIVPGR